jgi:hypothetical protein
MIYVNWKEGLRIDIVDEENNYNKFLIVISDNGIPWYSSDITNGMFVAYGERFYIEYDIKIYECDINNGEIRLKHQSKFDCENKNLFFELFPNSQSELDIWIDYLVEFSNLKKCLIHIKKIENLSIKTNERIKIVENDSEIDYYSTYKIGWEDTLNYNPAGIKNLSSYQLINNCLLKK